MSVTPFETIPTRYDNVDTNNAADINKLSSTVKVRTFGFLIADDPISKTTSYGYVFAPYNCTLERIRMFVVTAPDGDNVEIDFYKNDVAFSSCVIFDGDTTGSTTSFSPAVTFAAGDKIDTDIIEVGSSTAGSNLQILFDVIRTS